MPPRVLRFVTNGHVLLLLACGFLGTMAVAAKIAFQHLPTGEVIFLRFLGGWLIVWPLVRFGLIDLKVRNRRLLYGRGILSGVAIVCYFYGIAKVPVGHAVLLNTTYPLFVAMLSIPILKERVGTDIFVCFAIAFAGIAIMLHPAGAARGGPLAGYAIALTSAVFAAGAIMATRVLRRTDSAITIFYYFSLLGALISLPLALNDPVIPKGTGLLALLVVIVFSMIGQLLLNQAFKYARAGEGSVVMMANTAVAAALGAWLLGDRYTREFFVGALLIFVAIAWITAKARVQVSLPRASRGTPIP
jgi:drug/metabolite transporter (DMT)-like permease